ncbi:MAG TPA: efflux RND transporter periplasmic adaptor subunit, partial [Anaerolineaceae bacterium]|nr:efflux RND transporter periplasmic adaptor subunit [Anaerolineaceae bacterium]
TTTAAQAQLALVNAQEAFDDAQQSRANYDYNLYTPDTLEIARTTYYLALDKVNKAEEIYANFEDKPEDDPLRAQAANTLANARQNADQAYNNLNYLIAGPDSYDISVADANIALAEARLADAQREWDRLKNGPDPDDVRSAEVRIAALEAALDSQNLRAPFAATVTEVNALPGDMVSPGTTSFRIDDLSHLLVDVNIPEVDINRIQLGQSVTLSFDAITERQYTGQVVEVARVGTIQQGVVNFQVTIELNDADEDVRPGMTAAVNIVVEQLEDVLLVPNRAVRSSGGQRVVYVLRLGIPTPVPVEIGATSDLVSELLPGEVQEGDVLVLNPPTQIIPSDAMFGR